MLKIRSLRRQGLSPVDLDLDRGECVAVMGASGAGKSLFLRAVADLDPNEGEVSLDGIERAATPAPTWRRRVTYVAAESGWWADTVGEHFADIAAAGPLVAAMALPSDVLDWPVDRLSTGECQRLGLARALAQDPPVLLLDEPTSGLDEETQARVERLLQERLLASASIIAVTHDRNQARRLATRMLRFDAGRAVETTP